MLLILSLTVRPLKISRPEELKAKADSVRPYRLVEVLPERDTAPEDSALVWVGYTPEELVIYARLYQRGINASSRRRDSRSLLEGKEDILRVSLNTRGWGVVSDDYGVVVNPLGTVGDYRGRYAWDGENYAEAHTYDWGWEVLLRISFSTLDYTRKPWGFNVSRKIVAKSEVQMLSPNLNGDPKSDARLVLDWDYIRPKRAVSVVLIPSFRLQSEADTAWNGNIRKRRVLPIAGITFRAKRGQNELLDATLLPDFSDVDVDIKEFQLNRLPVDYPEKRPYFVEGRAYAPDSRLIRTRNLVQPIFGVKFYSANERNDIYVNTLRDLYLGDVAFGKLAWRPTDEMALSSSFVLTDSAGYQVFGGRGRYYFRPLNTYLSASLYRNFPVGAPRLSLSLNRYTDRGLSISVWYDRTGRGFLSPFNYRTLHFDNVSLRGVWAEYKGYLKPFGRTLYFEVGGTYKHRREIGGEVLSDGGHPYYFLLLTPYLLGGEAEITYYGYLKHLYHYDTLYGIRDFTARYITVLSGYFASEWKSATVSVSFGHYLGHPMRSYSLEVQVSPFGVNVGLVAYAYRTVLDDLKAVQYYGEIPLPYGILAKPYLNYTRDDLWGGNYLEGNLVLLYEPRPLTGIYLAINKRLTGDRPEGLHHTYEKEVFKVQVRWRVW